MLDADPLADIRNSDKIASVMLNGRLYDAVTMNEVGHGNVEARRSTIGSKRRAFALDVEPEVHHVAVLDDVFLAFLADLAGFLGAALAVERDVVVVGDGLGADEALLEVGVDDAGGLRGGRRPCGWSRRGPPSGRR